MAWSAPMTAVANATWTAAEFNTYVRDNLLTTSPALVSQAGQYVVSSGANALTARTPLKAYIRVNDYTTSTSYVALPVTPGPSLTFSHGTMMFVAFGAFMGASAPGAQLSMALDMSGSNTIAAADSGYYCMIQVPAAGGSWTGYCARLVTGMTAGTSTVTFKYKVTAGTGNWPYRTVTIIPL